MFGEVVTRIRRDATGTDRYGNPTFTDVEEPIPGAAVALGDFAEPVEVGRNTVVTDLTLLWPAATVDGRADDRWVVRGSSYESVGPAFPWVSPFTQQVGGTVVRLRAVTG